MNAATKRQESLIRRGYVYATYQHYSDGSTEAGTILTLHRTMDAAQKAAKGKSMIGVKELSANPSKDRFGF